MRRETYAFTTSTKTSVRKFVLTESNEEVDRHRYLYACRVLGGCTCLLLAKQIRFMFSTGLGVRDAVATLGVYRSVAEFYAKHSRFEMEAVRTIQGIFVPLVLIILVVISVRFWDVLKGKFL